MGNTGVTPLCAERANPATMSVKRDVKTPSVPATTSAISLRCPAITGASNSMASAGRDVFPSGMLVLHYFMQFQLQFLLFLLHFAIALTIALIRLLAHCSCAKPRALCAIASSRIAALHALKPRRIAATPVKTVIMRVSAHAWIA